MQTANQQLHMCLHDHTAPLQSFVFIRGTHALHSWHKNPSLRWLPQISTSISLISFWSSKILTNKCSFKREKSRIHFMLTRRCHHASCPSVKRAVVGRVIFQLFPFPLVADFNALRPFQLKGSRQVSNAP